jgi:hypothetical protein
MNNGASDCVGLARVSGKKPETRALFLGLSELTQPRHQLGRHTPGAGLRKREVQVMDVDVPEQRPIQGGESRPPLEQQPGCSALRLYGTQRVELAPHVMRVAVRDQAAALGIEQHGDALALGDLYFADVENVAAVVLLVALQAASDAVRGVRFQELARAVH